MLSFTEHFFILCKFPIFLGFFFYFYTTGLLGIYYGFQFCGFYGILECANKWVSAVYMCFLCLFLGSYTLVCFVLYSVCLLHCTIFDYYYYYCYFLMRDRNGVNPDER